MIHIFLVDENKRKWVKYKEMKSNVHKKVNCP